MKKKIVSVILIILLISAVTGFFAIKRVLKVIELPANPDYTEMITVEIEMGATTKDIAEILKENGITSSVTGFRLFSKLNDYDGTFQAGIYQLSPSMTTDEIATKLQNGQAQSFMITIPEGLSVSEIADKFDSEGIVTREAFMEVAANGEFEYDFLNDELGALRMEGFLFPETYSFPIDVDAHTIMDTMLLQFSEVYSEEYIARTQELGLTISEVVTIASIIEREAILDEERSVVSSVIYNRLEIGMKLEMCSTVQYVLGEHKQFLTYDDTSRESDYNTYLHEGLPPTPIAVPGKASIEAALYPEDTPYLYFVVSADQDGSMEFSENYDEFLVNKEAYYNSVEDTN